MDTLGTLAPTHTQYIPQHLNSGQKQIVLYLIQNPKASKIIVTLCDKKSSYLNEIQQSVVGSKTSTIQILKDLESMGIITSEWKIEEMKGKGGPSSRAVKSFRLSQDKEKLIEFYEPFFRKIE
jgi:hypothetical protein